MPEPKLLLKDVVQVGDLDLRTTRYVMDRSQHLGLPTTAGRGEYRRFDLMQACRLVNATRLVTCGVKLEYADGVPALLEKRARREGTPPRYPFEPEDGRRPWALRLLSTRYVQAWRGTLKPPNYRPTDNIDWFYDTHEQRYATLDDYDDDDSRVLVTWNLSALGLKLYARLRAAGQ